MSHKGHLRAVILDLDGILVDTSKFHARAWADLVRSVGCEPPDDWIAVREGAPGEEEPAGELFLACEESSSSSFERSMKRFNGMFTVEVHWQSPAGRELRLVQRMFADLSGPDAAFAQYQIELLNCSGTFEVSSWLDRRMPSFIPGSSVQDGDVVRTAEAGEHAAAMSASGDGRSAALAVGMTVLDRPAVGYDAVLSDAGIGISSSIPLERDDLLYVDCAVTAAVTGNEEAAVTAVGESIERAVEQSFADARVNAGAIWKEHWEGDSS
jgi:trehalose/maltose hydrolase-like predicted phosphorylase